MHSPQKCPKCFSGDCYWVGWSPRVRTLKDGARDVLRCALCGYAFRYARTGRRLTMRPGTFRLAEPNYAFLA